MYAHRNQEVVKAEWETKAARMLFGSDHPFAHPTEPRRILDLLPCSAADRELIRCGNACELLGLRPAVPRPDRG